MTSHRFFYRRDGQRYDWYRMGAEVLIGAAGSVAGLLERGRPYRGQSADQHQLCAVVFGQGAAAGAGFEGALRRRRRLGPPSQRSGESDRLCRNEMEARFSAGAFLASDRSGRRVGRRSAANAGVVHQRQPGAAIDGPCAKLRDYVDRGGFHFGRSRVSVRRRIRPGVSRVDGKSFRGAGVSAEAVAAGASAVERRRTGAAGAAPEFVEHRLRLPHQRDLLRAAGEARFAARVVVLLGIGVGARSQAAADDCKSKCMRRCRWGSTFWRTPRIAN